MHKWLLMVAQPNDDPRPWLRAVLKRCPINECQPTPNMLPPAIDDLASLMPIEEVRRFRSE